MGGLYGESPEPACRLFTSGGIVSRNFDTIARLIAGVALGLEYAHEQRVIHRDIKPANLLLSRDGRLSINDFGLARTLEQPGLTASGEFVGSPMYMAPEQISAGRTPLDHRADIYSLGATLYQLLTLEPPAEGTTRDEVLASLLHREPIRLRQHRPQIPVDLETICLKAMERDPDRRYQSGGEFAVRPDTAPTVLRGRSWSSEQRSALIKTAAHRIIAL